MCILGTGLVRACCIDRFDLAKSEGRADLDNSNNLPHWGIRGQEFIHEHGTQFVGYDIPRFFDHRRQTVPLFEIDGGLEVECDYHAVLLCPLASFQAGAATLEV